MTPEALAKNIGTERADSVIAYLRRHPEAVVQRAPGSLDVARTKLSQSLAAYRAGNRPAAQELALAAYLDGFEPLEPMLTARDATERKSGGLGKRVSVRVDLGGRRINKNKK